MLPIDVRCNKYPVLARGKRRLRLIKHREIKLIIKVGGYICTPLPGSGQGWPHSPPYSHRQCPRTCHGAVPRRSVPSRCHEPVPRTGKGGGHKEAPAPPFAIKQSPRVGLEVERCSSIPGTTGCGMRDAGDDCGTLRASQARLTLISPALPWCRDHGGQLGAHSPWGDAGALPGFTPCSYSYRQICPENHRELGLAQE